jgi:pantoate--beta-alanine ligase
VEYLEVRDSLLGPAPVTGAGRLLVAARLGKTRLLDNVAIDIGTTVDADGRVPAVPANQTPESSWRN